MRKVFGGEIMIEIDHLEDLGVVGRLILKQILKRDGWLCSGWFWFSTGANGGLSTL
jgi:hypothetical protein